MFHGKQTLHLATECNFRIHTLLWRIQPVLLTLFGTEEIHAIIAEVNCYRVVSGKSLPARHASKHHFI
jgi:hypothetical protein